MQSGCYPTFSGFHLIVYTKPFPPTPLSDHITVSKGQVHHPFTILKNKLVGQILDFISQIEMLSRMDLHDNKLLILDLSHKHLTRSIPSDVIGHFKDMQMYLNLSYNNSAGSVPEELGMLEIVHAIDIFKQCHSQ
ncbi:hypothetical protein PIB30_014705 [Stylosanthes scabra]|uniref:Uncharacterized protein n=1 Tax=Stylosanthes scabra TaxID=79078 RepID=A0ABU6U5T5_9FABA|nr:hypothetical protein [Stylosanthes scabra]